MGILVTLGILFLALIGTPIFVVMGLAALVAFYFSGIESAAVSVEIYKIASSPSLLTIPLFTFAGYLMAESGSPKRMVRVAEAALGWMPGGVAIMGLFVCAFFTAFTGASGVTIIAMGGLLYPILRNENYSDKFTLGIITASGSLGLLFPPSLPIILYGIVAHVDIDVLFKAGIVPGIVLIIILSSWCIINGTKTEKKHHKFSFKELRIALKDAIWEVLLPFGVLGGIYGGFTTVTEAATITLAYVLIVEMVIYRDVHPIKDLPRIVADSMSLVGAILLILSTALALTNFLVDREVPMMLIIFMKKYLSNRYSFLFLLNIFLLIINMMDIFSAIIIVVPLILPIAKEFGVHPVHLAIIFLTNLELGYLTPPLGINLILSSFRFKRPVTDLYKASVPFWFLLFLGLMLITYLPWLSLLWVK
jgi:tripartite ATP-independent transporter DctM subunit